MLSCKQLVFCSSDYLDGQLRVTERLSVRTHLLMCGNCRRFVQQMRLTQRVVQQMPEPMVDNLEAVATQLAETLKQSR